jgi:uncharacterized protein (TIGR01777 family)
MAKVILAGGSGFIGQILSKHFADKGDEVVVLSRSPKVTTLKVKHVYWDAQTTGEWVESLNGSDILINLTGKSVNCRYNEANKKEIFASRLLSTQILGQALETVAQPPKVWINAASATIYRHAEDGPQDEFTGEVGTGFSVEVCRQWEQVFFEQEIPRVRKIGLRLAIVLGKNGGVMSYFKNLTKFFLGGKQGNGRQYFSWIHESDVTGIIDFLIAKPELEGIFNVSAPNPVPNNVFMAQLRKTMNVPFGVPTPAWLLNIGSVLIGTETELILKSRWVMPQRLLNVGYKFVTPTIQEAISRSV